MFKDKAIGNLIDEFINDYDTPITYILHENGFAVYGKYTGKLLASGMTEKILFAYVFGYKDCFFDRPFFIGKSLDIPRYAPQFDAQCL